MADDDRPASRPADAPDTAADEAPPHSHLIPFPEALEAFFTRLPELRALVGPAHAAGIDGVGEQIRAALAARERGDVPAATRMIATAMHQLATVVADALPTEGPLLRAMAARFEDAMRHGALGDAKDAAEVMRVQSDSTIIPRK